MGKRSDYGMNPTLTNYATGVAQDKTSALAEFMAPTVPVGATVGKHKKFDDRNDFQVLDTERALGGPANRIEFGAEDADYNCRPHALEAPIDDAERDAAGDDQLGLEQSKAATLVTSAVLSHEVRVHSKILAGVSAASGLGKWSQPDVDPVDEIDSLIEAIANETGRMPNALMFGLGAWRKFRGHPKVIARQPGATLQGLTPEAAGGMLLNPSIELRIGVLAGNAAKFGATRNVSNIAGLNVLVFYRSATPSLYDPSLAKTFRGNRGGIQSVRVYRADSNRSDMLAVDWSEDVQVVSAICGKRLAIT